VYSLFTEVLLGLSTIRSYAKENEFLQRHFEVSDANGKCYFLFWMASRWLAVRIDALANLVILFVGVIAVLMRDLKAPVDSNMLGLALVYALQLTGLLQWTVRVVIETENNMTAVERLAAFGDIESEAPRTTELDRDLSGDWPERGEIVIRNLHMRYREGLELVLRGVDLSIPAGSKVGICGRTGSGITQPPTINSSLSFHIYTIGKSSLMLAMFRIVEPLEGSSIEIDGVDALKMGLEKLRSNMTSA